MQDIITNLQDAIASVQNDESFNNLVRFNTNLSSNTYVIWKAAYGVMQPLTQAADGAVKLLNMIK